MMNNESPPLLNSRPTINPYRFAASLVLNRLRWDMNPIAWRSRARLRAQKDKYANKRGLILCNGPSLNKVDFDAVAQAQSRDVVVFGLNKINLLFERSEMRPDMIVAVNPKVIEQNLGFYTKTDIPLYLSSSAVAKIKWRPNITFLHASQQRRFARDVSISINEGYTVTYVAMQLAFHFGIRDLALVGCDHNFATKGYANQTVVSGEKDESHFDPSYFAGGSKWDLPDLAASEYHYSLAGENFAVLGGRIVNCTQGGCLEIFPRTSLGSWLNGAQKAGKV